METIKKDNKDAPDHDQIETTDLSSKKSCFGEALELNFDSMAAIHIECFKTFDKKEVFLHLFSNMIVRSP
jgi:hypothetical protein